MKIDYNNLTIQEKDNFLRAGDSDKKELSSMLLIECRVFQNGLLSGRIILELQLLNQLMGISEVGELPPIDLSKYNEKGYRSFDLLDLMECNLTDELATLLINKYSSIKESMQKTLPLEDNFHVIEQHIDYLWSVQNEEGADFEEFHIASSFRSLTADSFHALVDVKKWLSKMANTTCFVHCEKTEKYISAQGKVIKCLKGLLDSFDLMKSLAADSQKMKRLSIFLILEKKYPTVDWTGEENVFLAGSGFSCGGDFSYTEYLSRLFDIYRKLNALFLKFWKGFFPKEEELKSKANEIQIWLNKSEFYFESRGKPFEGIMTEHIAYSNSLAAGSAYMAHFNMFSFLKDMWNFMVTRAFEIAEYEASDIEESDVNFAAEAEVICSSGYELKDMFEESDGENAPENY